MTHFRGLIPPLCTPLTESGSVDRESLTRLIDTQLHAGVDGLFVLGSSGEAIYLTDAQREEVVDVTTERVSGAVPVFVGAVEPTTQRVIEQLNWIHAYPISAIVVTAPFYANVSPTEQITHFSAIAAASRFPVLAYDIPGNVGRRIDPDVALLLLSDNVISGIKDSSGTLNEFRILIDRLGPTRTVSLLTGADILADLAMDIGADGLIPGLANVRPDLFVSLLQAHRDGNTAAVRAHQIAITSLTAIFGIGQQHGLGRHASELGALKHLLRRDGIINSTAVSAPLSPYPPAAARELEKLDKAIRDRHAQDLSVLASAVA